MFSQQEMSAYFSSANEDNLSFNLQERQFAVRQADQETLARAKGKEQLLEYWCQIGLMRKEVHYDRARHLTIVRYKRNAVSSVEPKQCA